MATKNGVPFRQVLVDSSKYSLKCPYAMTPKKITIHATDNQATANNEISYMRNNNSSTSFHVAIDEKEAVQGLPFNRNGWHAGDGRNGYGNRNTIGVEMCRSYDRNRKTTRLNEPLKSQWEKTFNNTIKFVAQLCVDLGIVANKSNIKKHQDWSGKYCPRKILDDKTWDKLVNGIIEEYNRLTGKKSSNEPKKSSSGSNPKETTSTYKGNSIVDYLKSIGVDSSFANRKRLAQKYGIKNYTGTATQNLQLLRIMRDGSKPIGNVKKTSNKATTTTKKKTIAQMATEIIQGKHGNGHENRRKSLGIDKETYEKVRAEVNRRLK